MVTTETISYYFNSVASVSSSCVEKTNKYLNSCADSLAARAVPWVVDGYIWAGEKASHLAGVALDPASEKWVKEAWTDPLSTEWILAISNKIEKLTEKLAERKPTDNKYLEFLDKSMIGVARWIYRYVKHSNQILRIPPYVKEKIQEFSLEKWLQGPRKWFGRSWWWISGGAVLIWQGFFYLIQAVLKVVNFFMPFFIYSHRPESLKAVNKLVESVVQNPRMELAQAVEQYVVEKENDTRKEIVSSVATTALNYVASGVSRVAVKGTAGTLGYYCLLKPAMKAAGLEFYYDLIGAGLVVGGVYATKTSENPKWEALKWAAGIAGYYMLVQPAMESIGISGPLMSGCDTIALAGAVASIWQWGIKPSLQPYYDSYAKGFNKHGSTLLDFCKETSLSRYYKIFHKFEKLGTPK